MVLLFLLVLTVAWYIIKYIYIPTTHLKLNEDIRQLGTTLRRHQGQLESTKSALTEKSKLVESLQAIIKTLESQLEQAHKQDYGSRDSQTELISIRRENTELSAKIRTLESTVCSVQQQLTETQSANLELVSRLRNEAARSQRMNSIDQLRLQHDDLSSLVVLASSSSPPIMSSTTVSAASVADSADERDGSKEEEEKTTMTNDQGSGSANAEHPVVVVESESSSKMLSEEDGSKTTNGEDNNNDDLNDAQVESAEPNRTESLEQPSDEANDHHQVESNEAGDEIVADNGDDRNVQNVQAERVEHFSESQEEPLSDHETHHDRAEGEPGDENDQSARNVDREFHLATVNLTGQETSNEGENKLSNEDETTNTATEIEAKPLDTPSASAAVVDKDRSTPMLLGTDEINAEAKHQDGENEGATEILQSDVKNTLDHLALNPDLSIDEDDEDKDNKSETGNHRNTSHSAYSAAIAVENVAEGTEEEETFLKVYRNPWEHAIHPICTRGTEGMATAALGPAVNDVSHGVFAQTDVRTPQI